MLLRAHFVSCGILTMALAVAAPSAEAHSDKKRHHHHHGKTVVDAPFTYVETDDDRHGSRVDVEAPFANVEVDDRRGRVRIDVPFFSGDIRY